MATASPGPRASELDGKRVFLVACADAAHRDALESLIRTNISNAQTYGAKDGAEALFKIANAHPHVAILEDGLQKTATVEVVRQLLAMKDRRAAVIVAAPQHDSDLFMDEVVTGQVQFFSSLDSQLTLLNCVNRALNWASLDEPSTYRSKFMSPGETLLREGDEGLFVYIVRRGRLKAIKLEAGAETILGFIEPGEFVGEMAYINGEPRSADVVCLEESELIEIPKENLDSVLFSKPAWSKSLMKTLSKRLKLSNDKASKRV